MKSFFEKIGIKMRAFAQGRYGADELSRFLSLSSFILLLLSVIPYLRFLYLVALALLIWSTFRTFSKNLYKRREERNKYMQIKNKITGKFKLMKCKWRDRKTHRYYTCPHCKAVVRISNPGRGRIISIRCPKCTNSFDKRT